MLFLCLLMRIAPALVFRPLAELRNVHWSFPVWCISIICSFKWHHSCLLQCHVKLVTEFYSKSSLCSSSHGEEQKDFILWGHSFKRFNIQRHRAPQNTTEEWELWQYEACFIGGRLSAGWSQRGWRRGWWGEDLFKIVVPDLRCRSYR